MPETFTPTHGQNMNEPINNPLWEGLKDIKFSLYEIALATGTIPYFGGGISYGVVKLDIPLADGKVLSFRQGDEDIDHEVTVK